MHNIEIIDNHIIAMAGARRALVDTGSPVSFCEGGSLEIFGRTHTLPSSMMGITCRQISEYVGTTVGALLGMDVLGGYALTVDPVRLTISTEVQTSEDPQGSTPIMLAMGIPTIRANVNGDDVTVFLDTGAKLSYLDLERTAGLEQIDAQSDLHPSFGRFESPVFELPVTLWGRQRPIGFGNLPPLFQMAMSLMQGVDGILGSDILKWGSICFDFPGRRLSVVRG